MLRKEFLKTLNGMSKKEKNIAIIEGLENSSIDNAILFKTRLKNIFTDGQDNDLFNNNIVATVLTEKNVNLNDIKYLLTSQSGQLDSEAVAYEIAENIKKQAKNQLEKNHFKSDYNKKIKELFEDFKTVNTEKENIFKYISDYLFTAKGRQVKNDGVKAVFSAIACIKNDGVKAGFTWIYREFIFEVNGDKSELYDQAVQIQTEKPVLSELDIYKNGLESLIGIFEKMKEYTESYKNLNNLTFNDFRKEQFEKLEKVRNSNIIELEKMLKEYKRYSIEF